MTASMPARTEPFEDDPDSRDVSSGEREVKNAAPAAIPRKPRAATGAGKKPRPLRVAGAAPANMPKPVAAADKPDPGPPPPLPADVVAPKHAAPMIVVPPKPPLPPVVPVAAPVPPVLPVAVPAPPDPPVAAPVPPVLPIAAAAPPVLPTAPVAEPEPEVVAELEPEVVAELQPEVVEDPQGAPAPDPEPEPALLPQPELVVPPQAAALEPVALAILVEPPDHEAAEALAVALTDDGAAAQTLAGAPALAVRGLTKRFGDTIAVDGIDLTVPAGAFYGLVGPNGAGKTTTLSMIAGLLRPDRGRIEVCGVDAANDPVGAKRLMGVLPDRLRTFDRLTGRQLLYYYGILRGLRPAVVESRTADLARAFDLTDALGRAVSDYSAGMTKKVMLAGAMIHSPRLLVLDEPFEAVDPVSSAIILDILGTYVAHGGTVILSSHGMELVERVCSRVAVIVAGQALAEGTVADVRGELTLEQRFIELAGGLSDVEGLEWLHTFSD